jgi:hypothetical protein
MSYIGNTQQNQSFVPAVDYFSGNGSTTAFTLSRPVKSVYELEVVVNNVQQNPSSAYTVNGSTITFTGAPSSGTNNIYVSYTSPNTQIVQPGQGTVSTTSIADGAVTTAKLASTTGTGAVALASLPTFTTTIGVGGATASASGSGITFPATQVASSDANTLDDYEEGTWTPVPKFGGANVGMSYSSTGKYTKIGNLVFVEANFAITTNGSSTGNVTIEGLPFTSSANAYAGELIGDGFTFTGASISAIIESTGTTINLAIQVGGAGSLGGYSYMQQSSIGIGGKRICMTYLA